MSNQPIHTRSFFRYVYLICLLLLLVACQGQPAESTNSSAASSRGKILLWHSWEGTEAQVLAAVLREFDQIYPNLSVISQAVPASELRQRYEQAARLGLGPDLFIAPGEWLVPLAEEELIQDLRPYAPSTENYLSSALASLTYEQALYGLPLALRPMALYYNTALVDSPAATLDEWLAQTANGRSAAINVNFSAAFWGIQAFGGDLFDETGRTVLDQGGFANWLSWLRSAQSTPGMILSRDVDSLRDLFFSGKAAYYTGSPDDLPAARAALGVDGVSVTVLPAGPNGPSGPLLHVEAIYFNQASPAAQTRQALVLAAFLTNTTQSTTLMRELGRVPANRAVQVDPRLHPAEAGFAAQARTAVPVPHLPQAALVFSRGDEVTRSVLEGVLDVTEASTLLTNEVNDAFGYGRLDMPQEQCAISGVINVWQVEDSRLASVLRQTATDYMRRCPNAFIVVSEQPQTTIEAIYGQPAPLQSQNTRASLILGPDSWLLPFVQAGSIQPLTGLLTAEMRQRFVPAALSTVEMGGDLYGVPYWLELDVLYYNSQLVSDPPATLAELRQKASEGRKVALLLDFRRAYWGATAFGAQLFTPTYRLALAQTGFADWLAWLEQVQREPNILLIQDPAQAQAAFVAGEVALLIGPASMLGALEAQMAPDMLRVTRLPAGPQGEARPWLQTAVFYFANALNEEQQALALDFVTFATNSANQTALMTQTRLVPVNVNVNTENAPVISSFLQRVNSAFVPPNVPQLTAVLAYGPQVYTALLEDDVSPVDLACQLTRVVDSANGFSIAAAELPAICQESED